MTQTDNLLTHMNIAAWQAPGACPTLRLVQSADTGLLRMSINPRSVPPLRVQSALHTVFDR